MTQPKKPKRRSAKAAAALVYVDDDTTRFEARLHKNARGKEPRVPPMTAREGKRTRFTGLSSKGSVAALKSGRAKKKTA